MSFHVATAPFLYELPLSFASLEECADNSPYTSLIRQKLTHLELSIIEPLALAP
jgi:hypothetical protein